MDRRLAHGEKTGAAAQVADVRLAADGCQHPGSEAVRGQQRIGAGVKDDPKPVAAGGVVAVVGEPGGVGRHQDVQVAVVVGVDEGDAAALADVIEACGRGDVGEDRVAGVPEQVAGLARPLAAAGPADVRPAVDLQDVDAGVVIEIDGDGSPPPAAVVGPGGAGVLDIDVIAPGHVEHVADVDVVGFGIVLVDRRHVPVEQAVVVEVGDGLPHPRLVEAGPGGAGHVGERSVGVVYEVPAGDEVRGDE